MAELLGWGPVQHPRSVSSATDLASLLQDAQRAGHCGAMRPDEICEPLVRKRERYGDAVRQNPPPAFGQMPKREQQPVIDPLMVSDGEGDGECVGAPSPAVEQLQPELRPRVHPHHKAVIEHGQSRGLEDDPANLRLNVRPLVVPAPRADHVARSDEFHAPPSQHFNLTTDQSIDDQEAAMMTVGLLGGGDVPIAGRQAPYRGPSLAPGPLPILRRQEIPHLGIGIDDADRGRGRVHARHSISQGPTSRPCFARRLTSRPGYPPDRACRRTCVSARVRSRVYRVAGFRAPPARSFPGHPWSRCMRDITEERS
jgi:hypothetical protein